MNFPSQEALQNGEIEIHGRLVAASNATLLGTIRYNSEEFDVIYKPVQGERPLWDFPEGTLAAREVSAYLLSELGGFHCVPPTVLRDGPFGIGAVQVWIDVAQKDDFIEWAQSVDPQLRRLALFDAIINNTDRKFGHILCDQQGKVFGCDHGVTFHVEDKLRTVLWQFADFELDGEEIGILKNIAKDVPTSQLPQLLDPSEIDALQVRIERLYATSRFPLPSEEWPPVPWPPV